MYNPNLPTGIDDPAEDEEYNECDCGDEISINRTMCDTCFDEIDL